MGKKKYRKNRNKIMIPYSKQEITNKDISAVVKVMRSPWLTQGPMVEKFENMISKYSNVKYASAVNSATSALHLACMALNVGPGDWVWTSSNSFVASANCAIYCGAKIDFDYLFPFIESFSLNLENGLKTYISNSGSIIHSPVFYILTSFIYKFTESLVTIKIFYILICSILPLIFYFILKDKFEINKNILFIFSLIIFLSPYFRSSAIWLLGDNLSLIFFGLSIYYFNKIEELKKNNFLNSFLCLFFLILCCYIRYYYCLFSLYYLFFFYQKINKRYFFLLLLISFILSLPAIFYFYYIFLNSNFSNTVINYSQINFYSNSLIILSILLFYLFPFQMRRGVADHFKPTFKPIHSFDTKLLCTKSNLCDTYGI